MNASKINGYTEEEAKSLIEYVWSGKKAGKTLTSLFESYGDRHGRAKGSVRNYYYALMKNVKNDERVVRLLQGKELRVETIREFTPEETHQAVKSILAEKSKGISVRRAVINLSAGDGKKMLRLQNKYRNVLKKQPEIILAAEKELGVETSVLDKRKDRPIFTSGEKSESTKKITPRAMREGLLQRRLEQEINDLYRRIAGALKEENARLKAENERLKKGKESGL